MSHAHIAAHIDRHAYTNALAKKSPTTKICYAFSALFLSVLSPTPIVPLIVFTVSGILILRFAKIPTHFYLHALYYLTIVTAVSSLIIALFFGYGQPLAELVTPWFTWTIYRNGASTAIYTFARVEGATSAVYFLVLTTSMTNIFITLRKVRIPKILVEMSLLIYRYIFVFIEISAKMQTAQVLRAGTSGWIRRIRSTALLAGNLFIRTLDQGERTFTAMNARGYDGNIRVLEDLPKPRITALAAIAVFDALLVIAALLTMNFGVV